MATTMYGFIADGSPLVCPLCLPPLSPSLEHDKDKDLWRSPLTLPRVGPVLLPPLQLSICSPRSPAPVPPLYEAIRSGNLVEVDRMLSIDPILLDTRLRFGRTPLLLSARHGHNKLVELLVTKGAKTRVTDDAGFNCLYYALRRGDCDLIQHLRRAVGSWCLGKVDCTPVAMSPTTTSPLHILAQHNRHEGLEMMLAEGMMEVDGPPRCRSTPLQVAVSWGSNESIAVLLRYGADPSRVNWEEAASTCFYTPQVHLYY